jgi:putative membrane protein
MNRRHFLHVSLSAAAGLAATSPFSHAAHGKIGQLDPAEFKRLNQEAGARMAAIKPGNEKLSEADQKLLVEIVMGGMTQLELSRAAVKSANSEDVRIIAHAEVEEQTGLSLKLKEIATAKDVILPATLDDKAQKRLSKLQQKSGAKFDREYLNEVGIDGHQKLEKTMKKVQSKAADATLKAVAETALPLIQTHLQVSQDEIKDVV